jgi:hypothetical protein
MLNPSAFIQPRFANSPIVMPALAIMNLTIWSLPPTLRFIANLHLNAFSVDAEWRGQVARACDSRRRKGEAVARIQWGAADATGINIVFFDSLRQIVLPAKQRMEQPAVDSRYSRPDCCWRFLFNATAQPQGGTHFG